MTESKGSKGVLNGMHQNTQEGKNKNSQEVKNVNSQEVLVKRSYAIKESTDLKLNQIQLSLKKDSIKKDLQDIVDEAICFYFEKNFKD